MNREAEVFLLDPDQVAHYWERIEAELDAAPELWRSWYSKESMRRHIDSGHLQVWAVCPDGGPINAVFMTHVAMSETERFLVVFWIRGRLPDGALQCMAATLDRFAASQACERIVVYGRRGWERALRSLGAEFDCVVLSRQVPRQSLN